MTFHKSNFYSLEYDVRSRLSLTDMDWTEPGEQDMARLLRSTPGSIETIIATAQWVLRSATTGSSP